MTNPVRDWYTSYNSILKMRKVLGSSGRWALARPRWQTWPTCCMPWRARVGQCERKSENEREGENANANERERERERMRTRASERAREKARERESAHARERERARERETVLADRASACERVMPRTWLAVRAGGRICIRVALQRGRGGHSERETGAVR